MPADSRVRWASSKARSGTANWSRRSSLLCGEARSATYAYCLPLSRFCSYVVLSRASGESPLATRPWPEAKREAAGGHRIARMLKRLRRFSSRVRPPGCPCSRCGAASVQRLEGSRDAAVTLPHDATG